jgi:hypothetical protein
VAAAAARVGGIQRERQPDLDLRVVNVVPRRHDPDHRGRAAVDLDDAPDDRLVACERRLPHLGGQHRHVLSPRKRVRAGELTTPDRRYSEHRHQLGGDDRRIHPSWLFHGAEIHRAGAVRADLVKRSLPLAELDELGGRHPELIEAEGRKLAGDEEEPFRLRIWQRLQQHAVDHAEDRAVRTNTQRERQDGDRGIRRTLPEAAEGMNQVLAEGVHRCG